MRHLVAVAVFCLAATALPQARQGQAVPLARSGWDALNAGRVPEAASAFDAALKLAPQQPTLLLGAGIAARLQGRKTMPAVCCSTR